MDIQRTFLAAGEAFAELVLRVPDQAWDAPALGVWDVRALVGHASRALTTVVDYLQRPADSVACHDAIDYFAAVDPSDERLHAAVADRGVAAGAALGEDPASAVRDLLAAVRAALPADDPVITTIVGGMHLSAFLETRILELTVHGLDLADAVGADFAAPEDAVALTLDLLARVGLRRGLGPAAIRVLTGRGGSSLSVL